MTDNFRICKSCKENLPLEGFRQDKDGYYRKMCRGCTAIYYQEYAQRNSEKLKRYGKIYRTEHREKIAAYLSAYTNEYQVKREQTDVHFRIRRRLSTRLRSAIKTKRGQKNKTTVELLGCTVAHFVSHLQSLWQPGMSWENYGQKGWHIDHIRPCASFDLTDPDQQKQCFHYTNLQPLWAIDNLKKGDKYESQ